MRNKLTFIWKILISKENGWIFFQMTEKDQLDYLNGSGEPEITIRGIGVDNRVLNSIGKRIEGGATIEVNNSEININ